MQELEKKYQEKYFKDTDLFSLENITAVNHKPHPYTVGSKHIAHAAANHSGMLGDATLKAVKCAHPGCILSYEEHTSDTVMFIKLKRHMTHAEANGFLLSIKEDMEADKLDGIAFIETKEQFRVDDVEEAKIVEDEHK